MKSKSNDISWQKFVHNVVWLRKHYEFSKEKMAQIMGIEVTLLEEVEKGNGADDLSVEVIFLIHKYFGIRPNWLMGKWLGEDNSML